MIVKAPSEIEKALSDFDDMTRLQTASLRHEKALAISRARAIETEAAKGFRHEMEEHQRNYEAWEVEQPI